MGRMRGMRDLMPFLRDPQEGHEEFLRFLKGMRAAFLA
jgi:hypothetical protein